MVSYVLETTLLFLYWIQPAATCHMFFLLWLVGLFIILHHAGHLVPCNGLALFNMPVFKLLPPSQILPFLSMQIKRHSHLQGASSDPPVNRAKALQMFITPTSQNLVFLTYLVFLSLLAFNFVCLSLTFPIKFKCSLGPSLVLL